MLYQYIKDKERSEGIREGIREGELKMACKIISAKFRVAPELIDEHLKDLGPEAVARLAEKMFEWNSFEQVLDWIAKNKAS